MKITSAIKTKNFFPGYIGQAAAVGEMNEVLTLEEIGKPLPLRPRLLTGGAGLGKTRFALAIAAARENIHGGEHRLIEIAPGTTRPAVIKMLARDAANRPATIFVDEAHDMEKRLRNMLKPILETGGEPRDVTLSEECIFPANPLQHLWIFASNEDCAARDPALFGPTGRTTAVHFVPYNTADKGALIRLSLSSGDDENAVKIDSDAVEFLCGRVWPNARAITQEMAPELKQKAILAGGKVNLAFAKAFCAGELSHLPKEERKTVARYPLGLLWVDIQTLEFLSADTKGKQVSEIGHYCGGEPMKSTSYRLQWLASLGLTATLASGRKGLTQQGASYLHTMKEIARRAEAARKGARTKAKATAGELPALQAVG